MNESIYRIIKPRTNSATAIWDTVADKLKLEDAQVKCLELNDEMEEIGTLHQVTTMAVA